MERGQGALEDLVVVDHRFWRSKKVFLTGHTGFKGSWLALWLGAMGAEVKGFALTPDTPENLFGAAGVADFLDSEIGDIRDLDAVRASIAGFSPDILIHMAAQPLVRLSYQDPVATYATNLMGTVHVLEAARHATSLRAIVSVTTDKCYENREWPWGYRENEPMGGHDPYSNSKGCAELASAAYRKSFFDGADAPGLATGRAGNVIGGGDWSADRLIPDVLRSFEAGEQVPIRNPLATRPWQHVLEPLGGYLILAQRLWDEPRRFAEGWNFGPRDEDVWPVQAVVEGLVERWGEGAGWVRDEHWHPHEARALKLDISKARAQLGWGPRWGLGETLDRIVGWHRAWLGGQDMRAYCLEEIAAYERTQPAAAGARAG